MYAAAVVFAAALAAVGTAAQSISFHSQVNAGLCVDVPLSAPAETQIELWTCNGQTNQQFNFAGNELKVAETGLCLDVSHADSGISNGQKVQVFTCQGSFNQQWKRVFTDPAGVWFQIQMVNSNWCLNTNGLSAGAGQKLVVWTCDTSAASLWKN
ncbi:ricin B lectin domain-containing protein [Zopfochytrium polystomum]|nr:ricin B lectin domain-containing protein [Zopfochytrium polystomum]